MNQPLRQARRRPPPPPVPRSARPRPVGGRTATVTRGAGTRASSPPDRGVRPSGAAGWRGGSGRPVGRPLASGCQRGGTSGAWQAPAPRGTREPGRGFAPERRSGRARGRDRPCHPAGAGGGSAGERRGSPRGGTRSTRDGWSAPDHPTGGAVRRPAGGPSSWWWGPRVRVAGRDQVVPVGRPAGRGVPHPGGEGVPLRGRSRPATAFGQPQSPTLGNPPTWSTHSSSTSQTGAGRGAGTSASDLSRSTGTWPPSTMSSRSEAGSILPGVSTPQTVGSRTGRSHCYWPVTSPARPP